MNYVIVALALMTFVSTMIGGLLAVRLRKIVHFFFAFASGALIGVTFFDILPESLEIADSIGLSIRYVMISIVTVFVFYSFLERYFLTHHHDDNHGHIMGPIGATGLVIHSFLDGIAIGTAFSVNYSVGIIVALAVIFHDFTDGINTVTLMLKNKHHVKNAKIFLLMDAIAPIVGVVIASIFFINQTILAVILAAFAGEFLYIGAANLLPETYKHKSWKMGALMVMGVILIFVLTSLV